MKNNYITKVALLVVLMLTGCMGGLKAQYAITFCGGDVHNSSGSLSCSVGQVAIKSSIAPAVTVVNITESFAEGVQQPSTPRDAVRYEQIDPLSVSMSVYPNPTSDYVVLESNQEIEQMQYTIFNSNGQVIYQSTYRGGQEEIDLRQYPAGNYLLKVVSADKNQMNVYKIIKAK